MSSRHPSSVPKDDIFPRLLYSDSRCSQACHVAPRCSPACPWHSQPCHRCSQPCCGRSQTCCGRSQTCCERSQTCRQRFQVLPKFSAVHQSVLNLITITPMVLLYQSSEIPVTLKADWNALQGFDTLLKLTHLGLHSTSSQTLLKASSD